MQDFGQKTKNCSQEFRFLGKRLKFAKFSERNFGGNPLVGGPKLIFFFELCKFICIFVPCS
jgi:hypothetical protein